MNFLYAFQQNLKKTCFLTTMTSISVLNLVSLNDMQSIINKNRIKKLMIFLKNKFYDRKESSLTKFYSRRSKFTVF